MKKFVSAAVLGLLLVGVATPASAQRVISMATLAPNGSTWARVFDAANRELRRRTNNQISIRWYFGGVQGDEAEVVRKMRSGRLDGAACTAVGLGQIHRPILAFQMPGMFDRPEQFNNARAALGSQLTQAFNAAGFHMLGFGGTGAPRLMSTREVRTPNDLRAARPWQWRDDIILPALYQEAGATGVPLQVPEVLTALQTNRVDTLVASPLAAVALQWGSSMRYISDRSNTASLGGLVVTRAVYDQIPADQQQIVREVFDQFSLLLARNVSRDDDIAVQTLTQRGVQVVQLNDGERSQWTAIFGRVRQRLAGTVADAAWIERVRAAGQSPPPAAPAAPPAAAR